MTDMGKWSTRLSRDTVLFVAGLAGIAYETLAQGGERPTLLILFAAMVGLPAFLRSDESTNSTEGGSGTNDDPQQRDQESAES